MIREDSRARARGLLFRRYRVAASSDVLHVVVVLVSLSEERGEGEWVVGAVGAA